MGVPEMAKIASMIGRAVKTDNPSVHAQIKAEVLDLTAQFPAYPRS